MFQIGFKISFSVEGEEDYSILANGRRPKKIQKWKTTSIFLPMEDDHNIFANGRRPHFENGKLSQSLINGRQPKYFSKGMFPESN